jgi:4-amino-4-deoxy-L-arabinose transferase-like glycosyltransferase
VSSAPPRRLAAAIVALTLLSVALRVLHLGAQPVVPDDLSVAATAQAFVDAGWPGPTMWNHPRLRDVLVAASLDAFGEGPWGIKAWSVLLGSLCAPAAALMALLLTGSGAVAAILGLLVATDPLHVDFSRQGINDVYLAFFPVAAIAAAWRYRASHRTGWLALAGALFGLGLASKWSVAAPLVVTLAVLVADLRRTAAGERRTEGAFTLACLVVLPLAVYLATFLPWFQRGHGLGDWLGFQRAMALETATHAGYEGTKLPGYPGELVGAWKWFLVPAYYADAGMSPSGPLVLVGVANPAVWLLVWPAFLHVAWLGWRRRAGGALLLVALFVTTYAPLALTPRPIWTNTALAVLPFALALVARSAAELWAARPRLTGAWLAGAVAVAALLWFPAVGIATAPGDALLHALVPDDALVPPELP